MAWQTQTIRGKSVEVLVTHNDGTDDHVIPKFYLTKPDVEFLTKADNDATANGTSVRTELEGRNYYNGINGWTVFEPFTIIVADYNAQVSNIRTNKELTDRQTQQRTELDDHESRITALET